MKRFVTICLVSLWASACSHQSVYELAAAHQCQQNEKNALDPKPTECWSSKELDGKNFEEYRRERGEEQNKR